MNKKEPRILLYDIETSYTIGAVWGLYEQNVAKVLREPYILTVAWKWLGEKETHVLGLPDFKEYKKNKRSDKYIVQEMWKLFDEADVIIAHNGNSFDQKWTYARFVVNGMIPPSPSKYVDTKVIAKSKFRFNSNKLDSIGEYFGIGRKIKTDIDLWIDCVENDDSLAWSRMKRYNKMDVTLLERVYLKLLPYITNHPNYNVYTGETHSCPNCGSCDLQKRGFYRTRTTQKQQYQCKGCYAWSYGEKLVQ